MDSKTQDLKNEVQEYYGKTLKTSSDLQTNACCTLIDYPDHIKKGLSLIHEEVSSKYYGCGLCVPEEIKTCRVLDLGSGSGRDCYLLSYLVGENGSVVGVDMTPEQLAVSRRHLDYHKNQFNHKKSNIEFVEGDLEKLDLLSFQENSFDIVISNCVINLVQNKESILKEVFRILKPGGEFYFSDVYSDRRIPEYLVKDPILYGECLSGAIYWNDFENLSKKTGFTDPRIIETSPLSINNKKLEKKIIGYSFKSTTYRLFKINNLEAQCEDYGQAVCYKGSLETSKTSFTLDNDHIFQKGKIELVCGNTYKMLNETRFNKHFDFYGDWTSHFGLFDCSSTKTPSKESKIDSSSGCC